jgi:hypothetical protein
LRIQIYQQRARESEKFKMMMMGAQFGGVPDDAESGVEEW